MFCHVLVVACLLLQQTTGAADAPVEADAPVLAASGIGPDPAAEQPPRRPAPVVAPAPNLFQTRVSHEAFGVGVAGAKVVDLSLDLRAAPRWRVTAQGQRQWKFGRTETRAGGGASWQASRDADVEVSALLGPANQILPALDLAARGRWRRGRTELASEVRHLQFRFPGATAWIASPGVTVWLSDGWSVSARYAQRLTNIEGPGGVLSNHSALVRTAIRVHRRVWADIGGSSGVEGFDDFSPDRLGRYGAQTLHTGARVALPWMTAISVRTEYQRRSSGLSVFELSAGLTRGF